MQEHPAGGLVVIQVAGTRREYRKGDVPGARFLWSQAFAPSTSDGTYDLPTLAQATASSTRWASPGFADRARPFGDGRPGRRRERC